LYLTHVFEEILFGCLLGVFVVIEIELEILFGDFTEDEVGVFDGLVIDLRFLQE